MDQGRTDDTPDRLDTPGKRALYSNLEDNEALALRLDEIVKGCRPDSWRGDETKERVIKKALFDELKDKGHRVAVIDNGSRANQTVITGTLGDIESLADAARLKGPALIIMGTVVTLRGKLKVGEVGDGAHRMTLAPREGL